MFIEFNVEHTVMSILAEEARKYKRTISDEVIELIKEVTSQDGFQPLQTIININVGSNTTISIIIKDIDMLETLTEHSNITGQSLQNYMANLTKFISNYILNKRTDKNYTIGGGFKFNTPQDNINFNPRFANSVHSSKFVSPIDLNGYDFNGQQGFAQTSTRDFNTIRSIISDVFNQQYSSYSIKLEQVYELPNQVILKTNDEERFNEYKKNINDSYQLLVEFIRRLILSDIKQYNTLLDKINNNKHSIYEFTITLSDTCSPLEFLRYKKKHDNWKVRKSKKGYLSKWKICLYFSKEQNGICYQYPEIIREDEND